MGFCHTHSGGMSTPTPVLRGSTYADLLAIPSVLLGFHPRESCVVMGMRGSRVAFSARLDLDWPIHRLDQVVDPILRALDNVGTCDVIVLGYGNDVEVVAESADRLAEVLGGARDVVVTDDRRYWLLADGELEPPGGHPYAFTDCGIAAQAVYNGIAVQESREAAVAAVRPPATDRMPGIEEQAAELATDLVDWTPQQELEALDALLSRAAPLGPREAALLGLLLRREELVAEILVRLDTTTAADILPHLVEARQWTGSSSEANVVGVLALACWLDGRGAQTNDCMDQLALLEPHHSLLLVLQRFQEGGLPPSLWDLD